MNQPRCGNCEGAESEMGSTKRTEEIVTRQYLGGGECKVEQIEDHVEKKSFRGYEELDDEWEKQGADEFGTKL